MQQILRGEQHRLTIPSAIASADCRPHTGSEHEHHDRRDLGRDPGAAPAPQALEHVRGDAERARPEEAAIRIAGAARRWASQAESAPNSATRMKVLTLRRPRLLALVLTLVPTSAPTKRAVAIALSSSISTLDFPRRPATARGSPLRDAGAPSSVTSADTDPRARRRRPRRREGRSEHGPGVSEGVNFAAFPARIDLRRQCRRGAPVEPAPAKLAASFRGSRR